MCTQSHIPHSPFSFVGSFFWHTIKFHLNKWKMDTNKNCAERRAKNIKLTAV